ncbi:glycosyltransferase family 2 protein [Laedolimicola ammoniilytica]|uniref:Glycosyltransferase n=1 Tax=Laedolimicola ammoniilytica TaxID=2981771 RepID=A0ABT2RZD9_9FIRM|nr:glycosyltransferase family 2 protein [Laedolimicola ammoniilytica]MCU6697648.1 glycosyltransferase [Laedolimicola ammoniilytica]SCI38742.1 PGL/p-HBAD biosynthesis glycosyltransferase Rv2957/MT3031 [uncultured Clostridium sp.]
MENPKVSIITTTYNDKENLKKIIAQVKNQDYENIEYVIVDGGSTDGTLEVIAEAAEYFGDRLKWISEKDKGIYDAINKGIRLSTGDILGCCFDQYAGPDVISKMVTIMEKEGTDGVHGDLYYMEGDKVVRYWHQGQGNIRFGWMPGHPTLYLRKSVYDKYGLYKTDYRISADYEFMIRILKDDKVKLSYLPEVLIYMSHGGTSTNSLGAYLAGMKEGHRALRENGVRFAWFTDLCRTLRVLAQFAQKG